MMVRHRDTLLRGRDPEVDVDAVAVAVDDAVHDDDSLLIPEGRESLLVPGDDLGVVGEGGLDAGVGDDHFGDCTGG